MANRHNPIKSNLSDTVECGHSRDRRSLLDGWMIPSTLGEIFFRPVPPQRRPLMRFAVADARATFLRKNLGTPEFDAEYQAAIKALQVGKPARQDRSTPIGSSTWLVERYRETGAWTGLSLATRRQREASPNPPIWR